MNVPKTLTLKSISGILSVSNSLGKYFGKYTSVKQFGKIFQVFYQCQTFWGNISESISVSNSFGILSVSKSLGNIS